LNLAILIGHFPPAAYGGAELQAEAWATRLARRHQVTVITRCDRFSPPGDERRDGFAIHRLAVSGVPLWRTLADLGSIERAVGAMRPRPDLLLCFQTFISGWAGTRAGRRLGIPAAVWIRGEAEYRLQASRFHRWLSPRVWSEAAGVLVQSEANRAALLVELERVSPGRVPLVRDKLAVVANGVDLPEPTTPPAAFRVLTAGRLIADKGVDLVIDACVRAGLPLTVAGDGPERSALERRAGGRDVRFAGQVDRATLDRLYRDASAVVLAARRGEGLPNVLLEAMAHGRAVVATPCAGANDLLAGGAAGLTVPPGDAGALAEVLRALAADPARAARLGVAGRSIAGRYAWSLVEPELEDALERWSRR